jgi:hypothetical protein
MRPTLVALTLSVLSIVWWPAVPAIAKDAQVARGTIATITGGSITLKVADRDMTFHVDKTTLVKARGASTKADRASAAGKSGLHLNDLLQTGQSVAVTYIEADGGFRATEITTLRASASNASGQAEMTSIGVVKSVGPDSITITGRSGGGASFEQTLKVDGATRVLAHGAGTAVAARGGSAPISELVGGGDHVSVWYHKKGSGLIASEVRVTAKSSH